MPVPVIAELMGLTSAYVFEHYVKPSGRHLEDAMTDAGSVPEGHESEGNP